MNNDKEIINLMNYISHLQDTIIALTDQVNRMSKIVEQHEKDIAIITKVVGKQL